MKKIKNILSLLAVVFTALSFEACFDEDMSDCDFGVRIYFDYTPMSYASAKEGIRTEDVTLLNLYVFDEDGFFVNDYQEEGIEFSEEYSMFIPDLPDGLYDMKVWGGLKEDYILKGDLIPGETTMEDLQIMLNCLDESSLTVTKEITPLFYAAKTDKTDKMIQVINGLEMQERFSFIQNTYRVNVTIEGLAERGGSYQIKIEDDQHTLNFDNSYTSTEKFNYITTCQKNGDVLEGSLSLMRLADTRTPILRVSNQSDTEPVFERDLVEMILAIRTLGGRVDFSYMHEFDLELIADPNLNFTIKINGWTIQTDETDL